MAHRHCFSCSSRLIQQRGIGYFQTGEVSDHRLVIGQCFESSLCNFRLIRGISRVPARVFQNVPANCRRRDGSVIAESDIRPSYLVELSDLPQPIQNLGLGRARRKIERLAKPNFIGYRSVDELVE